MQELREEEKVQGYSWRLQEGGEVMAKRQEASTKSKEAEESVPLWDWT